MTRPSSDPIIARPAALPGGPVLAGLGDAVLGPDLATAPNSLGFRSDRVATWLRMLLPEWVAGDAPMLGENGVGTLQMLERLRAFLPGSGRTGVILLSAGLEDCRATLRGVAPPEDASIAAIEAAAEITLAAGLKPVFILPPPSPLFANGLFAERYVTLAANLRRLSRRDPRIGIVDPAPHMVRARAFGIEPEAGLVGEDGELTVTGAYRLASAVADELRKGLGGSPELRRSDGTPLNDNPWLRRSPASPEEGGRLWADGYEVDVQGSAGLRLSWSGLEGGGQRLAIADRLGAGSGFIRLSQALAPERFAELAAGDPLEAFADIALQGNVRSVSAVCVHATPVWQGGFLGLHSQDRTEGPGFDRPVRARLRTPVFRVPARLTRLHVSLTIHIQGGGDIDAALDIHSLAVVATGRAPAVAPREADPIPHAA